MTLLKKIRESHPLFFPVAGKILVISLAVLLFYSTLRKTGSDVLGDLMKANHLIFAGAVLLYGIIQIFGSWRWKLLLEVQGISLSLFSVFKLTLIGSFFGLLIPGAASGDIIKIAYAGKQVPQRIPAITLTIVLDRILGLSGLFLIAFLVTVCNFGTLLPVFQANMQLRWALLAVNLGFVGSVMLYVIYRLRLRWQSRHPEAGTVFLEKFLPGGISRPLISFFQGLDLYRHCQKVLFIHLGISGCIHFLCGCCWYLLGKAFHETVMTFQQYQITSQISNATGILPVTPGGLGLRDFTATTFFRIFEMTPEEISGSIALSYSFCLLFWALTGALILVFSPNLRQYANYKGTK